MNAGGVVFVIVAGILLAALPRRSAVIPLLLGAAYTTRVPVLELGPANLSVLRILVIVGIIRVLGRGERLANGLNAVDRLLLAWAVFLIGVSLFHTSDAWTYRIGMVLGELGVYVLCRVFVRDLEEARQLFRVLCVALVPLAMLMLLEKYTAHNFFSIMGGTGEVNIRNGHVRAYGPFAHSILAGTVGATCVPMALSLWRTHRLHSVIGLSAAGAIVYASTSSGPIMMVGFTAVAMLIRKFRTRLGLIRWGTVAAIIALQIVMNDPVYFLMARIDITGGSTGWYRAQLIRSSLEHLGEWWAVGTDVTRHWMATGNHADEIHADITNHFLAMGVLGGLPLLILFVLMLMAAFRALGRALRDTEDRSPEQAFFLWTLGAMLFGQVMNFWSISPYDQSISFFYLILAVIAAAQRPAAALARTSLSGAAARGRHAVGALATAGTPSGARIFPGRSRWVSPGSSAPIERRAGTRWVRNRE